MGLVAAEIRDLGISEKIDSRIARNEKTNIPKSTLQRYVKDVLSHERHANVLCRIKVLNYERL